MLKNQLKILGFSLALATTTVFANSSIEEKRFQNEYSQKSTHLLVEYSGCNVSKLNDKQYLEELLTKAAVAGKFTVLKTAFHKFEPQGVTGLLLLSESHLSIHTWPEHGYAAVDLFTCGQNSPEESEVIIEKALECKFAEKMLMKRGDGIKTEYHH